MRGGWQAGARQAAADVTALIAPKPVTSTAPGIPLSLSLSRSRSLALSVTVTPVAVAAFASCSPGCNNQVPIGKLP